MQTQLDVIAHTDTHTCNDAVDTKCGGVTCRNSNPRLVSWEKGRVLEGFLSCQSRTLPDTDPHSPTPTPTPPTLTLTPPHRPSLPHTDPHSPYTDPTPPTLTLMDTVLSRTSVSHWPSSAPSAAKRWWVWRCALCSASRRRQSTSCRLLCCCSASITCTGQMEEDSVHTHAC